VPFYFPPFLSFSLFLLSFLHGVIQLFMYNAIYFIYSYGDVSCKINYKFFLVIPYDI
jgi:hypothetical protein